MLVLRILDSCYAERGLGKHNPEDPAGGVLGSRGGRRGLGWNRGPRERVGSAGQARGGGHGKARAWGGIPDRRGGRVPFRGRGAGRVSAPRGGARLRAGVARIGSRGAAGGGRSALCATGGAPPN